MNFSLPPKCIAALCSRQHDVEDEEGVLGDAASEMTLGHVVLSPDGTSIISSSRSESTHRSTMYSTLLPPNLLDGSFHDIEPYSTLHLPEPVRALVPYPFYDLSDPSTTLLLCSIPDHPARLVNALALQSGIVASYPYVRPETEETVAAHSLMFTRDGNQFLAGSDSELCIFDINQPGQEAIQRYKLRRDGRLGQKGQWRMKRGIVSSLAISHDEVLAVGTFGREIGLFEHNGQGGLVASFDLGETKRGSGVSQLSWTDCGRYLVISERKSDAIQVFDIRGQQKLLHTLEGHHADSMMKLKWSLTSNHEIWAGGMDGMVRVWEAIGKSEGSSTISGSWKAHQNPVISTMVHGSGSVIVTGSAPDRNIIRHANLSESEEGSEQPSESDVQDDDCADVMTAIWQLETIAEATDSMAASEERHANLVDGQPSPLTTLPRR